MALRRDFSRRSSPRASSARCRGRRRRRGRRARGSRREGVSFGALDIAPSWSIIATILESTERRPHHVRRSPKRGSSPLWFIDDLAYVHVDGEECGGAFSLERATSSCPGRQPRMPPLHVHHRDDRDVLRARGAKCGCSSAAARWWPRAGQAVLAPQLQGSARLPGRVRPMHASSSINSPAGFEQLPARRRRGQLPARNCLPPDRPFDPAALGDGPRPSTASRFSAPPECCAPRRRRAMTALRPAHAAPAGRSRHAAPAT